MGKATFRFCTQYGDFVLIETAKYCLSPQLQAKRKKRLRMVKAFLESDKIIEDWASDDLPPFRTKDTKWISTQIYLNRNTESIDPSLECVGSGGAITGGHFDVLILDDVDDDKTTFSAGVRRKTREWLSGTMQPVLTRKGFMLVVGTRKHMDDVYSHMIKDPTFMVLHDKAIIEFPESFSFETEIDRTGRDVIKGVSVKGTSKVLWPEQRPIEYLLKERATVGTRLFTREFQNEVQDSEDQMFKNDWIDRALSKGKGLGLREIPQVGNLRVIQAWDLALVSDPSKAERSDSDYTVGITWASDVNGNRYLLDITRFRGVSPSELYRRIEMFYKRWERNVSIVAVEKNNFGQLHTLNLKSRSDIPLREHQTTNKSKNSIFTGVPRLTVLFENEKVVLPSRDKDDRDTLDPLVQELIGFGVEKHDDTVLCLSIAEATLQNTSFEYSVSFGEKELNRWGESSEKYYEDADSKRMEELWNEFDFYDGE